MKKIIFLSFFISSFSFFGQQTVNNYKYVVVANKFEFFKKVDQYQTSSLTKFLFNKYGFTTYLSTDDLPRDLKENRCSNLFATINNASTMFTTKVNVVLKDCYNKIIYNSIVGESKEKDYKKSFHEAIRNAFKDPILKNYTYKSQIAINKAIVKVTETPKILPKVKKTAVVKTVVVNAIIPKKRIKSNTVIKKVLYAQATNNGFQLVDTTPKVFFIILKTKQENLFIIEGKNGVFYRNNSIWIAEYYQNNVLIQEEYQVKF